MATIGSFKKVGNDFQGEIVSLSLQARGVRIVAEANRSNENAPSHRIYVVRAEIGAAWSKRSEEGRDDLSLKLYDPSFNAPIYANLFDDEGREATPCSGRGRGKMATEASLRLSPARATWAVLLAVQTVVASNAEGAPRPTAAIRMAA